MPEGGIFMDSNTVQNHGKNKKIMYVLIAVLCVLLALAVAFLVAGPSSSKNKAVMKYTDEISKASGEIDQNLMSLVMSVVNSELGVDAYAGSGIWSAQYQEGSEKTVKDIVVAQGKSYAEGLLQAEYLFDCFYSFTFPKEYETHIDTFMSELVTAYCSKAKLEEYLSTFGTNTKSLSRYLTLVIKRDLLYKGLYSEDGLKYAEIEDLKKAEFEKNYFTADHILLKYSAGIKDDGTEIPLTAEEKQQKTEKAKTIYNEIINGARGFDDALIEFGEDTYVLGYPFGYFVSKNFDWSGISSDVQNSVREMEVGEVRFVDTEDGAYIVRKNPTAPELYKSNGDFNTYLESTAVQDDFLKLCEESCEITVNEELLSELDPEVIPSFDMSLLG
jgi:hypothetical protein